jgi:hypothetical protein
MRDSFDLTPQQYHAGLDKLWTALGVEGAQNEGVFTLAARVIEERMTLNKHAIDVLGDEVSTWTMQNIECYPRVGLWMEFIAEVYDLDYDTVLGWVEEDERMFCFDSSWVESKLEK